MRVVLDTNVLVSSLGLSGKTSRIWELAEEKRFELFASPFILEEFERVLLLKLNLSENLTRILVSEVKGLAQMVNPAMKLSVIKKDNSDNRILECAVESKSDVLVTGDLKHIRKLDTFEGIKILTPGEFMAIYFSGI